MNRKLFCEISPLTYAISEKKCIFARSLKNLCSFKHLAKTKQNEKLPYVISRHKSLIRRRLGNVDMRLQENKAVNLSLAAPKINRIIIRPGETFSFWYLVGNTTEKKGYKDYNFATSGILNSVSSEADVLIRNRIMTGTA